MKTARTSPAQNGFTLIETIIALTVMALVVTVLYAAFSTATRTWEKQGRRTEPLQRHMQLIRLLSLDLQQTLPYTMNWERGKQAFLAGGPSALFYVTRSGFGSPEKPEQGIYFSCLYLMEEEEGLQSLFIYKRAVPEEELAEEMSRFKGDLSGAADTFLPSQPMQEESVRVLSELRDAAFTYSGDPFEPFTANAPPFDGDPSLLSVRAEGVPGLSSSTWQEDVPPQQILLSYTFMDRSYSLHVPVHSDPPGEEASGEQS